MGIRDKNERVILFEKIKNLVKLNKTRVEICKELNIGIDCLKGIIRENNTTFKNLCLSEIGESLNPAKLKIRQTVSEELLRTYIIKYKSLNQIYKNEHISSRVINSLLNFYGYDNLQHFLNKNNISFKKEKLVKIPKENTGKFKKGHTLSKKLTDAEREISKLKAKENKKLYNSLNREKINLQKKLRLQNNPELRIRANLRKRLSFLLRKSLVSKTEQTMYLLGCSLEEFKEHLKSGFTEGMSFDNYGKWHIDHIIPCYYFDLTQKEQREVCFNYKNLQPLWAEDNLKKNKNLNFNSTYGISRWTND